MKTIYLIKNIASCTLIAVAIFFTVISFLRLRKNKPPKFIKQYIYYLILAFFIFALAMLGFILIPAGADTTAFMYLILTLIIYFLFHVSAKTFRYRHFMEIEQFLNMYIYNIFIMGFIAHVNNISSFTISTLGILTLEIITTSILIFIFTRNKNKINMYYSLFFMNIIFSSLMAITYALFFRDTWKEFILVGRIFSVIGFTIPLLLLSVEYVKDYLKKNKREVTFEEEQTHIFHIDNSILIELKNYSVNHNEDINAFINRIINT